MRQIIIAYLLFLVVNASGYAQKKPIENRYGVETDYIDNLIGLGQYQKAESEINILCAKLKDKKDTIASASLYFTKATLKSNTGDFNAAHTFYEESLSLLTHYSANPSYHINVTKGGMAYNHVKLKNYKISDSLFRSTSAAFLALDHYNYFYVLIGYIESLIDRENYLSSLRQCNLFLKNFKTFDFSESPNKERYTPILDRLVRLVHYHKAFSLLELDLNIDEAYALFRRYEKQNKKNTNQWSEFAIKSKINKYKALYFAKKNIDNDSLKIYLEKSIKESNGTIVILDSIKAQISKNLYAASKKESDYQKILISQKEAELEKQKSQSNFIKIIGILLFSILIAIILFLNQRQKYKNQKIEKLKTKSKLIKLDAIIEGEERERIRIAQDLHEGINGDLSAIKYEISSINLDNLNENCKKKLSSASETLDISINKVRDISYNLAPPSLSSFSLIEATKQFCNKALESNNIISEFYFFGEMPKLKPKTETAVYRIIQELVNNIINHAKATKAIVQISHIDDTLEITVEDNGVGFDIAPENYGLGLKTVTSRLFFLKSEKKIVSDKNGTSITINIDLKKHNSNNNNHILKVSTKEFNQIIRILYFCFT